MDQDRIDSLGLEPIRHIMDRIEETENIEQLMRALGRLAYNASLSFFFSFGIGVDPRHPSRYQVQLSQGGIPFSTRDMLVGPSNVSAPYQRHIEEMRHLAGDSRMDARDKAKRIVDFQTEIAKIHWPVEELRIPEKLDHPVGTNRKQGKGGTEKGIQLQDASAMPSYSDAHVLRSL